MASTLTGEDIGHLREAWLERVRGYFLVAAPAWRSKGKDVPQIASAIPLPAGITIMDATTWLRSDARFCEGDKPKRVTIVEAASLVLNTIATKHEKKAARLVRKATNRIGAPAYPPHALPLQAIGTGSGSLQLHPRAVPVDVDNRARVVPRSTAVIGRRPYGVAALSEAERSAATAFAAAEECATYGDLVNGFDDDDDFAEDGDADDEGRHGYERDVLSAARAHESGNEAVDGDESVPLHPSQSSAAFGWNGHDGNGVSDGQTVVADSGAIESYFLSGRIAAGGLDAGCSLLTRAGAAVLPEAALFGKFAPPTIGAAFEALYLNVHEPFCLAAIGVQGSGKSHTLACVLESCLLPFPDGDIVRLQRPMTALVLHYDRSVSSICEATGLIAAAAPVQTLLAAETGVAVPVPRSLPRERMVVLVSPTYFQQRKAFYGSYCDVKPLLFKWSTLTADHIKRIMRIEDDGNQLYVATMLNILRDFQREALLPDFDTFMRHVRDACSVKGQSGPLDQRLSLMETVVRESRVNVAIAGQSADLAEACVPGNLVVVDLTDPLLASTEANGIFQVLCEQFRQLPMRGGKVLALDEAHKFMGGDGSDGLSTAIINAARLMRHDGLRLIVSTQSPFALAPELLELVSVAVLHRFHSRDWHEYLAKKLTLAAGSFDAITRLQPGHAIVFASRAALGAPAAEAVVLPVCIRQRITADRGSTRTNRTAAATTCRSSSGGIGNSGGTY